MRIVTGQTMRASPAGSRPDMPASATAPPPSASRKARVRAGIASHAPGPATPPMKARAAPAAAVDGMGLGHGSGDPVEGPPDPGVADGPVRRLVGDDRGHAIRQPGGRLDRDHAPEAVADEHGPLGPGLVEKRGQVGEVLVHLHGPRRIQAARPAPPPVGGDDAQIAPGRQLPDERSELAAGRQRGVEDDDERREPVPERAAAELPGRRPRQRLEPDERGRNLVRREPLAAPRAERLVVGAAGDRAGRPRVLAQDDPGDGDRRPRSGRGAPPRRPRRSPGGRRARPPPPRGRRSRPRPRRGPRGGPRRRAARRRRGGRGRRCGASRRR